MKIDEIVSKCNAVFESNEIHLRADFDVTSFSIERTDVSGFNEVVEVPLVSDSLVDCTICDIWHMPLNDMVKDVIDGAIRTILETSKSILLPEKKYRLRWVDNEVDPGIGKACYLGRSTGVFGNATYWTTFSKDGAEVFTESDLEKLKQDNPNLAPAIDAMKEPAEDIK